MGTTYVTAPLSNFKTTLPEPRNDACKLVRGMQRKEIYLSQGMARIDTQSCALTSVHT